MTNFAGFRFDHRDSTVWRGERAVPLTRKAREVLGCLIAADGRWVSREEILAHVWPETHVVPGNVKVLIRELRRALRDDCRNPQFIRSEPRCGYAFIADTCRLPPTWTGPPSAAADRPHRLTFGVDHG